MAELGGLRRIIIAPGGRDPPWRCYSMHRHGISHDAVFM